MASAFGVVSFTDGLDTEALASFGERLEALGYDALWLPDLLGRDQFAVAGFLLGRTRRLRIATGIANVYGRDAYSTAQATRTLSELYDGRFVLGLGVGHPNAAERFAQTWLPPVQKLDDYLDALESVEFRSPAPRTHAPLYIAAHGPKMLELAARRTDGANTYLMPPAHTRQARTILGPEKELNVILPCCLCDDEAEGRRTGRKALSVYLELPAYIRQWARFGFDETDTLGSDHLIDSLVAWGDVSAVRTRITEHIEAGASQVELMPYRSRGRGVDWELLEALAPNSA